MFLLVSLSHIEAHSEEQSRFNIFVFSLLCPGRKIVGYVQAYCCAEIFEKHVYRYILLRLFEIGHWRAKLSC